MTRKKTFLLSLGGCLAFYLLTQADRVLAGGLDKYLQDQPLVVGSIRFIPVTLRDGMESQKTPSWPLKNPSKLFEEPVFRRNEERAVRAGLDLRKRLDEYFVAGYKDNSFFFLFYNFVTAAGCANDYVIQRIKLSKYYYDLSGSPYKKQEQFFVEALALNYKKETKKADEHWKEYALGKFFSRKIIIDLETGCGEIPKAVEGRRWPFSENPLYRTVQDYSNEPGLFNQVIFDFSSKYRIVMEFDRNGKYSLELPFEK